MPRWIKISGLEELHRKLLTIPIEVEKEIKIAMARAADDIVALAKTLAPVGQATGPNSSNNPGALRDSIGWTWGDPPKGSMPLGFVRSTPPTSGATRRGSRDSRDLFITIYAGNDEAFYARWVEFGTKSHGIDAVNQPTMGRAGRNFGSHVDHPGATARPFFYPAYRAKRRSAKSRITRGINRAFSRVARK